MIMAVHLLFDVHNRLIQNLAIIREAVNRQTLVHKEEYDKEIILLVFLGCLVEVMLNVLLNPKQSCSRYDGYDGYVDYLG
jgi:hypothetical protein